MKRLFRWFCRVVALYWQEAADDHRRKAAECDAKEAAWLQRIGLE